MTQAIAIGGLVKTYGEANALDGFDLAVPEGSVFGFLGPNGAGKTTTLRILSGLAHPTSGSAEVFGHDVVTSTSAVRAEIGFLPDVPGYYEWMTAPEFLRFAGGLFGLKGSVLDGRVDALLDLAGLTGVKTRIGGYSRGMKQRLGVAQALINAPRLLMLDEPTSALDPIGRKEVLDMIASLRGRTTVFFSTHILADVERVCDRVAILDKGRVVTSEAMADLKSRYGGQRFVIDTAGDASALLDRLLTETWVAEAMMLADGRLSVAVSDVETAQRALPAAIAQAGLGLKRFEPGEISLEEVFVDLVGGER
ncbi:MAG TPA: ABC transporter ATP-binding protein [Coriobacteriia bacterium]|nr:MAG: Nodulation ATP-binding protein I [Actinobacteria bacterium 66_15]HAL31066.1 ABC transporter ATP-binding protein [Coriobacteriia bacterium]